MDLDRLHPSSGKEKEPIQRSESKVLSPIYFLPFGIQLQNTFCIEIIAQRFPVEIISMPHVQVNLEEPQVDTDNLRAQVTFHVQTVSDNDLPPFNISFKILGLFAYSEDYKEEQVRTFLEQGSLSILLPFARELLLNICSRLQVPPMMLTMVQLAPPPSIPKSSPEEE